MDKWQKYWLYFVIIVSLIHLLRDVMQDLGINNFLSTIFVKEHKPDLLIFSKYNTYIIEFAEVLFAALALRMDSFTPFGYLTILIAIGTIVGFVVYWFLL